MSVAILPTKISVLPHVRKCSGSSNIALPVQRTSFATDSSDFTIFTSLVIRVFLGQFQQTSGLHLY